MARPGPDFSSHREAAEVEDYLFLVGTGLHPDRAAARVGVSRETLEKRMERHPDRTPA